MDYLKLLEHSYAMEADNPCPAESRLEYIGEKIFDFTTYDGEISAFFAEKAIEVCEAISNGTTFDYIKDIENYRWYLLMCNMPFFADRIEWGTSIRGAWWKAKSLKSCGLYIGDEQVLSMDFTSEQWSEFINALVTFSRSNIQLQP